MGPARLVFCGNKLQRQICQKHKHISFYASFHKRQQSTTSPAHATNSTRRHAKLTATDRARASLLEREFFETVLGSSATKRDAKGFLSRFDPKSDEALQNDPQAMQQTYALNTTVNLDNLYQPYKAVENSPTFSVSRYKQPNLNADRLIHTVVVKICDPQTLDQEGLLGIATTLVQLGRLGVRSIVVLDISLEGMSKKSFNRVQDIRQQSERIVDILHDLNPEGASLVDQSVTILDHPGPEHSFSPGSDELEFASQDFLLSSLQKGAIPVIPPMGQTLGSNIKLISANHIVAALTKSFAEKVSTTTSAVKVDRIIFLDSAGGIPDPSTNFNVQVFINLAHEYEEIRKELESRQRRSPVSSSTANHYLETLECIQKCLSTLPPSASALLTTPQEVSKSAHYSTDSTLATGVRTRPNRNPLIHNILTDKPLVSSSLPPARIYGAPHSNAPQSNSTFFKLGIPISIVPDPQQAQWIDPGLEGTPLRLNKANGIDLAKLVYLINDSFGRPLDVERYLQRIDGHIAGIIIAGDYEGGAILTWEAPYGRPDRPAVPYLDKFAVLRRCQGSGGVADIVFNAMVKRCFPRGVVWRSRRSNPVNKWYFERANGTWKIPDSNWTMFWTGDGIDFGNQPSNEQGIQERWNDYVAVCSNIQPTWADSKPPD